MRVVRKITLITLCVVLLLAVATCAAFMTRDESVACAPGGDLDQPIPNLKFDEISVSDDALRVKGDNISKKQLENATVIVSVASGLDLPIRAGVIAIMTAIQEATLQNLHHGYPGSSSLGLFQQISAWGSVSDRTTPRSSAEMFFSGGRGGQPGLVDIKEWQSLPLGQAAQAVQRSAFPDAYDQHESEARAIVGAIIGMDVSSTGSVTCAYPDPIENMVGFALLHVGSEYTWRDNAGVAFISAMAEMVNVQLPSDLNALMKYKGDKAGGVSVQVIDGGKIDSRDALRRGDIVIATTKAGGKPNIAYLELGPDPVLSVNTRANDFSEVVGKFGDIVDSQEFEVSKIVRVLRLTVTSSDGKWVFPMSKGSYNYRVDSYGPRLLNGDSYHNGADFGTAGMNVPLVAMHDGTIIRTGYAGAWGNYLVVETGVPVDSVPGATYKYLYAHLFRYEPGMIIGRKLRAGEPVGRVGNTGNSFGEHLHLTICTSMTCTSGNAEGSVDPIPFLKSVGIVP